MPGGQRRLQGGRDGQGTSGQWQPWTDTTTRAKPQHRPPAPVGGTSGLTGRGWERERQGTQGSTKVIAICNCEPPSHCSPFSLLSQRQVTGKDRASIEAIPHLHTSSVPFWHSKTIIEAKYPGALD